MRKLNAVVAIVGAVLLLASCASALKTGPGVDAAFEFPVIGDIPYNEDDKAVLKSQILPAIKAGNYPFVVHVGDYKGGGVACTAEADKTQLALIASLAPTPVFYTPGDNEWTDCDRFNDPATGKPQSELQRLKRVRELFFAKMPNSPDEMQLRKQGVASENMTWRYGNVRFATIHMVATSNGRREIAGDDPQAAGEEADRRDAAALSWLRTVVGLARDEGARALVIAMQADMGDVSATVRGQGCVGARAGREEICDPFVNLRSAVRDGAIEFGKPTLLIHGDTVPFTLGQAFAGDEADNLWVLNAAGDHGITGKGFHYGVQDATLVKVSTNGKVKFSATGLVTGVAPVEK